MRLTRPPTRHTLHRPSPARPSPARPRHCRRSHRRWSITAAVTVTVAAALAVTVVAASPATAADGGTQVVALAASVDQVLNNLRNWLMGILALLATVFFTVGGVRYLMAGGDPGEVERAKTAFKSAGWGYVGAALAPLVVTVLKGIVGA